jgi:hypothetical protein
MSVVKGSRTVVTPVFPGEMQQGYEAGQAAIAGERKLAGDQAKTAEDEAQINRELAEKTDEATRQANAEYQAEQLFQQEQKEARLNRYMSDLDALKADKGPGGFRDWEGGRKARGYLSIALGGLARGNTGGVNVALQRIDQQIANDQKQHAAEIENRIKAIELTHGFNKDLDAQGQAALDKLAVRKQLIYQDLNKHAAAQLAALGIPKAQQAGTLAQLGFDAKAAKAEQEFGKEHEIKLTDTMQVRPGKGGGSGTPRDALSKLAAFAQKNQGPENDPTVTAFAEHLYPGMKPAQLQGLVTSVRKSAQDAAAAKGSQIPTNFDSQGVHYVVNPSQTTVRGLTAARAQLGLIEGAIANGDEALAMVEKGAPTNFGVIKGAIGIGNEKSNTARAEANAKVASLRNAAASALKESMGVEAGKERAEAIFPDLPHTDAGMPQWRAKVKAGLDTMKVLKRAALNAAGATPAPAGAVGKPGGRPDPIETAIDALAEKNGL